MYKIKKITQNIFFKYTISQGGANILRLLTGFLTAKLVSPTALGLFQGVGLIHNYLPVAQMGIMNGLNRQYPYLLGKKEEESAYGLVAAAQTWFLLLGILSMLVLVVIGLLNVNQNYEIGIAYLAYGISAFFLFYNNNFLQILYRAGRDFNHLSKITIISSLIGLSSLLFVWKFGFIGLCIKLIIVFISEYFLLKKWLPIKTKPKVSFKELLVLFKIGFPIHLVGQISALWIVIIKTLILYIGGPLYLGYFAIAIMINSSMSVIPTSISQILYPKMSYMSGEGASLKELLKVNIKPTIINVIVIVPFILILYWAMPFLIDTFLPKYTPGIGAARAILFLTLVNVISSFNSIFLVTNKIMLYFWSMFIGITLSIIYIYLLYMFFGFKLESFVWGMVWGKLTMLLINIYSIYSLIQADKTEQ